MVRSTSKTDNDIAMVVVVVVVVVIDDRYVESLLKKIDASWSTMTTAFDESELFRLGLMIITGGSLTGIKNMSKLTDDVASSRS